MSDPSLLVTCATASDPTLAPAGRHTYYVLAPAPNLDARPDLRSLQAQEASARSSLTLAKNRWIPDPTFRVGYVLDQFVASGSQHQSLLVGVSIPLPFFDHW